MAETNVTDKDRPIRTAKFNASVGEEQLSYICAYCGKVNPITAGKCLRCGKRRPRNEYLKAIGKSSEAEDFRATMDREMAQAEQDRKEAQDMQLVRLVEERVADEKAQIEAQEAVKREQDRDAVQRLAAREAAIRVIEAERKAEEAIAGQARETEEMIRQEREKALYAAAQKIVSERAGIEQAAEERINIARAEIQKEANRSLAESIDTAEKDAARRAVMKVIAAEQSTEDRIRLERESTERAAMERIKEETDRIAQYEQAKHDAEREGIQRAVEERLRAEREIFGKQPGGQTPPYAYPGAPYLGMPQQNPVTIQPLAIVPYLNSQQPLYQYDPNQPRTMYMFVPDPPKEETVPEEQPPVYQEEPLVFKKPKKKGCARVVGFIQIILSAIILALAFVKPAFLATYLGGGAEPFEQVKSLFAGSFSFPAAVFPILWAVVIVMAVISLVQGIVRLARGEYARAGWLVGLILFLSIVATFAVQFLIDVKYLSKGIVFGEVIWLQVIYMVISFIILLISIIAEMVRIKRE